LNFSTFFVLGVPASMPSNLLPNSTHSLHPFIPPIHSTHSFHPSLHSFTPHIHSLPHSFTHSAQFTLHTVHPLHPIAPPVQVKYKILLKRARIFYAKGNAVAVQNIDSERSYLLCPFFSFHSYFFFFCSYKYGNQSSTTPKKNEERK
jgi:hypothetical protein